MRTGRFLLFTNGRSRLEAVHFGHLHVHKHHVETLAFECLNSLKAVIRNNDLIPLPLQESHGHGLIHRIVLGNQNSFVGSVLGFGRGRRSLRRGWAIASFPLIPGEDKEYGVVKLALPHWLGQIGFDTGLAATGRVVRP